MKNSMRFSRCLTAVCLMACGLGQWSAGGVGRGGRIAVSPVAEPQPPRLRVSNEAFGRLPLSFEENRGQHDSRIRYLSRGNGFTLFLTSDEAVLSLAKLSGRREVMLPTSSLPNPRKVRPRFNSSILRMKLLGANPSAEISGLGKQDGCVNYFRGTDPSRWYAKIPTFARVQYRDVYPGIDLVYYGNQRHLEYDFVVAPGGDPNRIKLAFKGAGSLEVDGEGGLLIHSQVGDIRLSRPLVYQDIEGVRRPIEGAFLRRGRDVVGFHVSEYDTTRSLIIDPVIVYASYLGGAGNDWGYAVVADASGNAFITGETRSPDFPTATPIQGTNQGGEKNQDAFVMRLNASGNGIVYSTYLGGTNDDYGFGLAVDSAGNAYVTGITQSGNFPVVNAVQPRYGGAIDAFVTKLSPNGDSLVYSTYVGSSNNDYGQGVAVDGSGDAYVMLATFSNNLPTGGARYAGGGDTYLLKINASGSQALYQNYLGGTGPDIGWGITVDSGGSVYVTGETASTDLPVRDAVQKINRGRYDAFVAKLVPSGADLAYLTYLGGINDEFGSIIAVDGTGSAYVTGPTYSRDFPTANPMQPDFGGLIDSFVTKLSPSGSALVYSTFLGGSADDLAFAIAVDSTGNAYITGTTKSDDFPKRDALQQLSGGGDAFITKLNATGSVILYSSPLGGSGIDEGYIVSVDPSGNAYLTGFTSSNDFPAARPLQAAYGGGGRDAFIAKIAAAAPAPQVTLYFPRLSSISGIPTGLDSSEFTGVAVANLESSNASLKITAFDKTGAQISGTGISNPATIILGPGQQLARVDSQIWGAGLPGKTSGAWFKIESTASRIVGFFLAFNESLSILDGADVSPRSLRYFVLPEIEDQGFTQIHVANPNPLPANIRFDLYRSDGSIRATANRTVTANGAVAESFTDLFPAIIPSASDYLRAVSDNGVVSFEFLGLSSRHVRGVNGQDVAAGTPVLYSPQYVVGGPDWFSTLSIVNLDSNAGNVTLEFIADDGTQLGATKVVPVSARGKIYVTDQKFFLDPGNTLRQGYLRITSSGPRLSGSITFGDPGRAVFSSALPLVSILNRSMVFSQVASNSTYFTGLALLNPGASDANVKIEVFSSGGALAATKQELIGARQRRSKVLTEYFPGLAAQEVGSGYIKITSDRGLASFALFGTRDLSVLSAVPPQIVP